MTMLILAICAGVSTIMLLYGLYGDIDHDENNEQASRRRILTELNEIEIHRPNHLVNRR